jgi:hypothetical protein
MWIETRGRQHRVYWHTGLDCPKKAYEPFPSQTQAELFISLARDSSLVGALGYLRDPSPGMLRKLLGMAPLAPARSLTPSARPLPAVADEGVGLVGVTFAELWTRFLEAQRHLEATTAEDYQSYGTFHLVPFFGAHDLGLIQRSSPLRESDAAPGAVYVDDWLKQMLTKERRNNVGNPMVGTVLSVKFIKNVITVLAQTFDMAIQARPALLEVNPARHIQLPKTDARECTSCRTSRPIWRCAARCTNTSGRTWTSRSEPEPGTARPPAWSKAVTQDVATWQT